MAAAERPPDPAPPPPAPPGPGRRTAARIAAVQALYGLEIAGGEASAAIADVLARAANGEMRAAAALPAPDADHLARLVDGVVRERDRLDALLAGVLAADLRLERLEVLLAAILRAGAFELLAMPEIPLKVVINEYVDVTHAFFAGREAMLVNGVLDRLAARLRPVDPPLEGAAVVERP